MHACSKQAYIYIYIVRAAIDTRSFLSRIRISIKPNVFACIFLDEIQFAKSETAPDFMRSQGRKIVELAFLALVGVLLRSDIRVTTSDSNDTYITRPTLTQVQYWNISNASFLRWCEIRDTLYLKGDYCKEELLDSRDQSKFEIAPILGRIFLDSPSWCCNLLSVVIIAIIVALSV